MTMLIADRHWIERIQAERRAAGADWRDEVWDGVTFVPPSPNNEHQVLSMRLGSILQDVVGWPGLGEVAGPVNLSDRAADWSHNYREPDLVVVLNGSAAVNHGTHWQGAVDFLVEIVSPDDRSRDKLPFYGSIGVHEVLILDRDPWALELYQLDGGRLRRVGTSTAERPDVLTSAVLPLTFQLTTGTARPWVRVTHAADGRTWTV